MAGSGTNIVKYLSSGELEFWPHEQRRIRPVTGGQGKPLILMVTECQAKGLELYLVGHTSEPVPHTIIIRETSKNH